MSSGEQDLKKRYLAIGISLLVAGAVCAAAGIWIFSDSRWQYLLLEIIGAALILAGLTPLIRLWQMRKPAGPSEAGGRTDAAGSSVHHAGDVITAEIIGVTRNLRGSSSENTEYYVICRAYDASMRQYETYTSRALKDYPGKQIIGKQVTVRFHSGQPGDYEVDLDTIR